MLISLPGKHVSCRIENQKVRDPKCRVRRQNVSAQNADICVKQHSMKTSQFLWSVSQQTLLRHEVYVFEIDILRPETSRFRAVSAFGFPGFRSLSIVGVRSPYENKAIILQMWHQSLSPTSVAYPGIFFLGGVQQIQLWTEDREVGDLGVVAPYSGVLEAAVIWYKKFHFI